MYFWYIQWWHRYRLGSRGSNPGRPRELVQNHVAMSKWTRVVICREKHFFRTKVVMNMLTPTPRTFDFSRQKARLRQLLSQLHFCKKFFLQKVATSFPNRIHEGKLLQIKSTCFRFWRETSNRLGLQIQHIHNNLQSKIMFFSADYDSKAIISLH